MSQAWIVRRLASVFAMLLIVCVSSLGCNRTPPAPPALTDEVKAAIQTEDQEVFQQESNQR